ncbi:MAG TPA: hypothetical protein VLD67_07360 [Vicinamibacterales bacterium]|nr:hypothetical protein [Vicinamibacterales bacterium]
MRLELLDATAPGGVSPVRRRTVEAVSRGSLGPVGPGVRPAGADLRPCGLLAAVLRGVAFATRRFPVPVRRLVLTVRDRPAAARRAAFRPRRVRVLRAARLPAALRLEVVRRRLLAAPFRAAGRAFARLRGVFAMSDVLSSLTRAPK